MKFDLKINIFVYYISLVLIIDQNKPDINIINVY